MRTGEIGHVNEVADASSIRSVEILSKYREGRS